MMGHRMRTESLAKDVGSLVTDFAASRVSHECIIIIGAADGIFLYVSWYQTPF